ncbi:hypothetical protein D3C85_765370 [compost metagenome]
MRKITKEELQDYVSDCGEFDKTHRKYSSFYCTATHTFKQADIDDHAEYGIDASDLLNVCVTLNGYWDESNGCEWEDIHFCKVEEYQEFVPEVVIPAHYVTKQKTLPFEYEFDE